MKRFPILVLALALAGCASWFLKGAEMAESPPANPAATYTVQACATPAGQAIQGPSATYYLEPDMSALYEIETNGKGARITNGWTDANGRYFFAWVGNGPGWQYYFPADASQPAIRMNYDAGTYEGDRSTPGVVRPVGTPGSTCVLQRAG